MAKYLVIGGGLAGLSSCIYLSRSGHEVELIEASPKLGGRTYSFYNNTLNIEVDNGQHILIGAYDNTFEFMKILGVSELPKYQSDLKIMFVKRGGDKTLLDADKGFYPMNLISALLGYSAMTKKEKVRVLKLFASIIFGSKRGLKNKTVIEWLKSNKQSPNSIKIFWDIIGVGALNTKLEEASAEIFYTLIKKIFLQGNKSSTIVLPKFPLNKLFVEPSINYFANKGINYSLSEKLISVETIGDAITKIKTNKREIADFDKVIFALPQHAYSKIISNENILHQDFIKMETSPIITVHLRTDKKITLENFVGLLDSQIHWIFNNNDHFSLVVSAAEEWIDLDSTKIIQIIKNELEDYFPDIYPLEINSYVVIKEKKATLKSNNTNEKLRKSIRSNYHNLKFAGDWTNTGLPGTIEGAILSGKLAAEEK